MIISFLDQLYTKKKITVSVIVKLTTAQFFFQLNVNTEKEDYQNNVRNGSGLSTRLCKEIYWKKTQQSIRGFENLC